MVGSWTRSSYGDFTERSTSVDNSVLDVDIKYFHFLNIFRYVKLFSLERDQDSTCLVDDPEISLHLLLLCTRPLP